MFKNENTKLRLLIFFFIMVFLSITIKYLLAYSIEEHIYTETSIVYKIFSDFSDLLLTLGFIGVIFDLIAKKSLQEEFMQLLINSFYSSDKIFQKLSANKQKELSYESLKNLVGDNRASSIFSSLVEPYLHWSENKYKYNFSYEIKFDDNIEESIYGPSDNFLVTEKLCYTKKYDVKEEISGFYIVLMMGESDGMIDDSELRLYTTIIDTDNNDFFDRLQNDKSLLKEFIDYRVNNQNLFHDLENIDIIQKNKTTVIIKSI